MGIVILRLMPIVRQFEPAFRSYEFVADTAIFAFVFGLTLLVNKFRFGRCFPGTGSISLHESLVRKLGRFRTISFWILVALLTLYAVVKGVVLLMGR